MEWHGVEDEATLELFYAAESGLENLVIQYIQEGADVNADNPVPFASGASHIHAACEGGHFNTVRILLDAGTNVNLQINYYDECESDRMTPFGFARCYDNIRNYLLIRGADLDEEIWIEKINHLVDSQKKKGKDTTSSELIKEALDCNTSDKIHGIENMTAILILRGTTVLDEGDSLKILKEIATIDDCNVLNMDTKQLLSSNGDIIPSSIDKYILLRILDLAMKHKSLELQQKIIIFLNENSNIYQKSNLLHHGAFANSLEILQNSIDTCDIEEKNADGNTALHIAAIFGGAEVLDFLLDSGANINEENNRGLLPFELARQTQNSDNTRLLLWRDCPIHRAIVLNDEEKIRNLLLQGADIDLQDSQGNTPLHLAAQIDGQIMKFFIENGANVLLQNKTGNTALHFAACDSDSKKAKLLLENGASSTHLLRNNREKLPIDLSRKNEDTFRIILIDFLNVAFKTAKFGTEKFQKLLGYEEGLFCLKKDFDNISLLQYIVNQGLTKEREELLELLIKIDRHRNQGSNDEECLTRIIRILRRGIRPSKGLKECIESLQERFAWGKGKMFFMVLISFVKNILLGWSLYVFDIWTDVKFSRDLFYLAKRNFTEEASICRAEMGTIISEFRQSPTCEIYGSNSFQCINEFNSYYDNATSLSCDIIEDRMDHAYQWTSAGIASSVHIIFPFLFREAFKKRRQKSYFFLT